MLALAHLLNPPPSQRGRAPEAVMVVADITASPDPNTANEQILPNEGARLPKRSTKTKRSASPIGSAFSNEAESSSVPALPSGANTLACVNQHKLSPSKQSRADKYMSRMEIHYDGREWEYKGYKWVKQGILSLRLMRVGSEKIEFVDERDVQLNNQKGLLQLWKDIGRPKPKNRLYQPLKILDETEDKKYETQWTGFDEESNTLEPASKMRKVAPDLVEEIQNTERTARQLGERSFHQAQKVNLHPAHEPAMEEGLRTEGEFDLRRVAMTAVVKQTCWFCTGTEPPEKAVDDSGEREYTCDEEPPTSQTSLRARNKRSRESLTNHGTEQLEVGSLHGALDDPEYCPAPGDESEANSDSLSSDEEQASHKRRKIRAEPSKNKSRGQPSAHPALTRLDQASEPISVAQEDAVAEPTDATFDEWILQDVVLKRTVMDGKAIFVFQFD
ncbi:hypothetical protein V2A60_002432 [Cordyceps javanica]